MARVQCRCGETLKVRSTDPDRLTCPRCGARIRVRRDSSAGPRNSGSDGYVRFHCPCGRRLKVRESDQTEAGKCPDCGRVVPVPDPDPLALHSPTKTSPPGLAGRTESSSRTEDMDLADLERLERWARRMDAKAGKPATFASEEQTSSHQAIQVVATANEQPAQASSPVRSEAGLRICSRCGKPLHISATVCRSCGEPVPKR